MTVVTPVLRYVSAPVVEDPEGEGTETGLNQLISLVRSLMKERV